MGLTGFLSCVRHAALRFFVVLPLIALAVFPAGVMPTQGSDGEMVLVLCTGDGPMLMTLDPTTGTFQKAPPSSPKSVCDWAMAQAGVSLPAAITLPVPPQTLVRAAPALASLDFRPTHDPRGIYARGPPFLI